MNTTSDAHQALILGTFQSIVSAVKTNPDLPPCYWSIAFSSDDAKFGFLTRVDDHTNTLDTVIAWMHSLGICPGQLNARIVQADNIDPGCLDRQLTRAEWNSIRPADGAWHPLTECVNVCAGHAAHPFEQMAS